MDLNEQELAKLERLVRDATYAPWEVRRQPLAGRTQRVVREVWATQNRGGRGLVATISSSPSGTKVPEADVQLIVEMRNALPRLLAEIRRSRAGDTEERKE